MARPEGVSLCHQGRCLGRLRVASDRSSFPAGGPPPGGVKGDLTRRMMRVLRALSPARRSPMAQSTAPRLRSQIFRLRNQPSSQPALGLEEVLPQATVQQVLQEEGASWKLIVYTPWVTFWTFFWQVLSPDRSCRAAVKRLAAWMGLRGGKLDDEDTGPYCKARAGCPNRPSSRLMRSLARQSHEEAPAGWRWCGRRVKVVDGGTAVMPDTPANQRAYPQNPSQKPGLGFPIARIVVLFCLATGSALETAIGRYSGKQTGENALYRSLWDELVPADVVLGDRYYCSYFDLALLCRRGVDGVFRLHQRRPSPTSAAAVGWGRRITS